MPEVSNSPRLLLKNPSPFFSTPPLFFILLQITRVGPLLIVLCVTSHQDKRRRGRGKKPHEDIKTSNWNVYRLVGEFIPNSHIPLYCWKQLFSYLWHSERSLLVPAQPQLEGWPVWLVLYFSGVEIKKKPKRECAEASRTFGMGTSGPHVEAQPGGKGC